MKDYIIFTDSGCDIKPELLKEWGVRSCALTFRFSDDNKEYNNYDMPVKEFYDRMRAGGVAKTSAINTATFSSAFKEALDEGFDILYLAFSSGLSTTFNSARLAAEELLVEYKDSKIEVIDTLAASAGQGLLVYLASLKKKEGLSIDELCDYVKKTVSTEAEETSTDCSCSCAELLNKLCSKGNHYIVGNTCKDTADTCVCK